jgi:cytochrome b6-f complex iron-sulfur subunit
MSETRLTITRRIFLRRAIKTFFLVFSVLSAILFSLILFPGRVRKKKVSFIYTCSVDALPVKGVRQFYLTYSLNSNTVSMKVFVVNTGTDLFALSPVCTHLGCLVNWNRNKARFLCPCHGGQYDMEGNVVAGPPPAPLRRLPMKTEKESVFVGLRL